MSEYKVGQKIKITIDGTIKELTGQGVYIKSDKNDTFYLKNQYDIRILEEPEPPIRSLIRMWDNSGQDWFAIRRYSGWLVTGRETFTSWDRIKTLCGNWELIR